MRTAPFHISTPTFFVPIRDETETGHRFQYATSTIYQSDTMGEIPMFGVNFADGRIKGYPLTRRFMCCMCAEHTLWVNSYVDNGDGTITDEATGLMWMKYAAGTLARQRGRRQDDLAGIAGLAENMVYADMTTGCFGCETAPSSVDYTSCLDTTNSAAIDPIFQATRSGYYGGRNLRSMVEHHASRWKADGKPCGLCFLRRGVGTDERRRAGRSRSGRAAERPQDGRGERLSIRE